MSYIIGLMGIYLIQDAAASIAFYPTEKWRWNHAARLIRACIGVTLVVIGAIEL